MRAVLDLGGDFVWDGDGLLMDWSRPAAAAAIYLFACVASNSARPRGQRPPAPPSALPAYIERYALAHNAVLVAFSALVCVCTSAHFAAEVSRVGLRSILCPPPQQLQPLAGPLHYWCYIFYLSKYYEMADTAILIARRKRIIPLHALHHAFIPLTMCILFDGGNSIALIGLGVVNSLVHVVMYSYYLCSDLGLKPPVTWKRSITRLQILQFSTGVVGCTYYWFLYFRDVRVHLYPPRWPLLEYTEGCSGGEPTTVLIGYLSNLALLWMFVNFYRRTYHHGTSGTANAKKTR